MSASNWVVCPRCMARARAAAAKAQDEAEASYGKVSAVEYQRKLDAVPQVREEDYGTFREDYEIYGAQAGTVTVSYGGGCEVCGLSLAFTDKHPVSGWEDLS